MFQHKKKVTAPKKVKLLTRIYNMFFPFKEHKPYQGTLGCLEVILIGSRIRPGPSMDPTGTLKWAPWFSFILVLTLTLFLFFINLKTFNNWSGCPELIKLWISNCFQRLFFHKMVQLRPPWISSSCERGRGAGINLIHFCLFDVDIFRFMLLNGELGRSNG